MTPFGRMAFPRFPEFAFSNPKRLESGFLAIPKKGTILYRGSTDDQQFGKGRTRVLDGSGP